MSILPNFNFDPSSSQVSHKKELVMAKEYGWDYEKNDFLLNDGKQVVTAGKEAVKVWIWHVLHTERYRYLAYSWNYGNELERLIGSGLSRDAAESEVKRYLEEALLVNPYINEIKDIEVTMYDSVLNVDFTVDTIYGEANMSVC